jgi:hypothetical protein
MNVPGHHQLHTTKLDIKIPIKTRRRVKFAPHSEQLTEDRFLNWSAQGARDSCHHAVRSRHRR